MDKKVTKTYRFYEDVIEHAESNPFIDSFSEEVCKLYREKFMCLRGLVSQLEQKEKECSDMKTQIKEIKSASKSNLTIPENAMIWLKSEGLRIFENYSLEGACKSFNRKFDQDLTYRQFKLYIQKIKGGDL